MTEHVPFLIVGAGMAGLGAIRALIQNGADFLVVEAEAEAGGLARTEMSGGFPFDRAGHFLHIQSPELQSAVAESGVPMVRHRRRASVMLGNCKIPFPLQFNLWAAPGPLRTAVLDGLVTRPRRLAGTPANLEQHLLQTWGRPLFDAFFEPFNTKLWGRPLAELPPDCLGRYLPAPDAELVRRGAREQIQDYGYNASFLYPASGKMGDLPAGLARKAGDRIRYRTRVAQIDLEARQCRTDRGMIQFDRLICTNPAPQALAMARIDTSGMNFDHNVLCVLGLGVVGAAAAENHWIYAPDRELPFHRISLTGAVGAKGEQPDSQSILVEYTIPRGRPTPDPAENAELALDWLIRHELLGPCRLDVVHPMVIDPAYVIHRQSGSGGRSRLAQQLAAAGMWLAGRYGSWEYHSMEESFLSGKAAAEAAISGLGHEPVRSAASEG